MHPVDTAITLSILKRLTTPFKNWKAYKSGVIDENGNILVKPKNRTPGQKASFSSLDILILNMKKLLAKIPGGASRFASYAAALYLLKEEEIKEENFLKFLMEVTLEEDDAGPPTNNVGSGNIAGTNGDDPPVFRKKNKYRVSTVLRRQRIDATK